MGTYISPPPKKLGAWLARADNTVYQAATDGFAMGYMLAQQSTGYTNENNPPNAIRQQGHASLVDGFIMPVRKNDYWKAVTNGGTIWWIPFS